MDGVKRVESVRVCVCVCMSCLIPLLSPVCVPSQCALQHYAKDTKCFACRVQTQGIFNTATELINTIKKRVSSSHTQRRERQGGEGREAFIGPSLTPFD